MKYTAIGYSYLHSKVVKRYFDDPVDAICAAIEIMGEGDKNSGVITPDQKFYDSSSWDLLWYPKAYALSL